MLPVSTGRTKVQIARHSDCTSASVYATFVHAAIIRGKLHLKDSTYYLYMFRQLSYTECNRSSV